MFYANNDFESKCLIIDKRTFLEWQKFIKRFRQIVEIKDIDFFEKDYIDLYIRDSRGLHTQKPLNVISRSVYN